MNTDSVVFVADFVEELLKDHMEDLGLLDVWRGDMNKLPRTPCAVVESGDKDREIQGANRYTAVTMSVFITIYFGKVQDVQINTREADEMAEAVETLLHGDPTMGGLVIHSMVSTLAPGYANKAGTLYRGTRIKFDTTSKVLLPNNLGS